MPMHRRSTKKWWLQQPLGGASRSHLIAIAFTLASCGGVHGGAPGELTFENAPEDDRERASEDETRCRDRDVDPLSEDDAPPAADDPPCAVERREE